MFTVASVLGRVNDRPVVQLLTSADLDNVPAVQRDIHQWVAWRHEQTAQGRWTKVPISAITGAKASVSDPTTWSDFNAAVKFAETGQADGIGFVITGDNGLVGIDLDACVGSDGILADWAAEIVNRLATYTEYSPSGGGLRMFAYGTWPADARNKVGMPGEDVDGKSPAIEVYSTGRYLAVTGRRLDGCSGDVANAPDGLEWLLDTHFAPKMATPPPARVCEPQPSVEEIIARASAAANGEKFTRLVSGDCSDYDSESEADLALCGILAFWCGRDPGQIDTVFRRSKLIRPKWDERRGSLTYGQRTIKKAVAGCDECYDWSPPSVICSSPHILCRTLVRPTRGAGGLVTINAADLMSQQLPDVEYVVEGLLPQGATILAGPPKSCKSWMALEVSLAVASGSEFLGFGVTQGDVLYLALEDNARRLQKRLRRLLGDSPPPAALEFAHEIPAVGADMEEKLEDWLRPRSGRARLVVIDTLGRAGVCARRQNENIFHQDYQRVAALKSLADQYGVAMLAVHHTRKAPTEDPLKSVSGSMGLTGAADGVFVLRKVRAQTNARLFVTGRDIEENALDLAWSPDTFRWSLASADDLLTTERRDILTELKRLGGHHWPKNLAVTLGKSHEAVKKTLSRMREAGQVGYDERSGYCAA
jgi:hypothetical protein